MKRLTAQLRYWADIAAQAVSALRDNRLRTLLSIGGIAIGITGVIAIGSVSKGGRHLIFSELETFGLRSVWVFRDFQDSDPKRTVRRGTGIDNDDLADFGAACCPAARRITPLIYGARRIQMVRVGERYARAGVSGVGVDYFAINNDEFVAGRSLRADDIRRRHQVAVIGPDVHRDLFGEREALGRDIRIGQDKFTVVGVLRGKDRGFLQSIGSSGGRNDNNRVLIPYTTYQRMLATKDINVLQVEADDIDRAKAAAGEVVAQLERGHQNKFVYRFETMAQYIETANRILQGVSLIGLIAASISLLVGGMGIMNIMSTSVLERTREIGLRKALGATRFDVLVQFLTEAVLISLIGGLLGLVLGLAASYGIAMATRFPLTPSALAILAALAVSVAVGLVSGYYPAHRAASLRPVAALRYE